MSNYIPDLHRSPEDEEVAIRTVAQSFPIPERAKATKDFIHELIDAEYDALVDYAETSISEAAANRAERCLRAIVEGSPEPAQYLIAARDNTRYRMCDEKPWAQLIHGRLFETDAMQLRRTIVEAHRDLFESERIADLESVVAGLTQQIKELTAKLENYRNRY